MSYVLIGKKSTAGANLVELAEYAIQNYVCDHGKGGRVIITKDSIIRKLKISPDANLPLYKISEFLSRKFSGAHVHSSDSGACIIIDIL